MAEMEGRSLAAQLRGGRLGGFTGEDVRSAFEMAAGDVNSVEKDLTTMGKETRHEFLRGDERADFLRGMNQDEFDILHRIARAYGPEGMNKLENIMEEAQQVHRADREQAGD